MTETPASARTTPRGEPEALSEAQLEALRSARAAARPVLRAARVARTNSLLLWSGVVILLISAIWSPLMLLFALVIGGAACLERRGARGLLRLDPASPRRLALNQFIVIAAALGYCGWHFFGVSSGAASLTSRLSEAGVREADLKAAGIQPEDFESLKSLLRAAIYGGIAAAALIYHSGLAAYYLTKRKAVSALRARDPDLARLAIDFQRAA